MAILPLLCIVSVAFTGLTKGAGVLPDGPLNAAVGGTVMFTTTLPPGTETPFLSVGWTFGVETIITSNTLNFTEPEYEGRITFFPSTGSLELRNLALDDSGEYRVSITPNGGAHLTGGTRLEVYEPVSSVTVTASSTDLVAFNSSVRLSCSSSGSSLSFLWMNSSSEVTGSDRVQLTDGGSTLTIVNVTRYDQGPFRCHVFNPVSNGTSDPINLSISFGPENTDLSVFPLIEYYVETSDITLFCSADSAPAAQFHWYLNGELLPNKGQELNLLNIQVHQGGNYSCQAFNQKTGRYQTSWTAFLFVLPRVFPVTLNVSSTDVVEFNSSVRMSCSGRGPLVSYRWFNGSWGLTSDRVQLTDGGSTLTIVNVTRYDWFPFMCRASNPVSSGGTERVELSISYGPENINLIISSSQEYYDTGSNITLSCSAVSTPAAQFYWFLNGDMLSDTGPELRLMNIQMSQSGNYSCQAFNQKTGRYETSQPSVVSVLERISGASVTSSTNLLIEGNSVNLTCDAAGSVFTRKWMKDGSDLILADNITLHDNNRVLSFQSLKRTDSGEYSCNISNPVSNDGAKYSMIVNYGPENVQISGPSEIHSQQTLTLKCSADSTPSPSYTWILHETEIHHSSVFTKDGTELSDSGNYTCRVMNPVTGRTSSAVHGLSVTAIPDKTSSCAAGCIAGIVVACLVVCGAAAGGGYYVFKNKKSRNTTKMGSKGLDNKVYSESQ